MRGYLEMAVEEKRKRAMIGVYGVMSNLVTQRTHEIGIGAALGASPRQRMGMVIGQGLYLAAAGIAIGTGFALLAGKALESCTRFPQATRLRF